jgi:hypothetical protein
MLFAKLWETSQAIIYQSDAYISDVIYRNDFHRKRGQNRISRLKKFGWSAVARWPKPEEMMVPPGQGYRRPRRRATRSHTASQLACS